MAPRFVDIGCSHEGKFFVYPLDRVAVVPGKDIIIGRGKDNCDINLFPEYLELALLGSEATRRGEERPASQEQQGIDGSSLEERAAYYGSCSRKHFAYSIPRISIMDLDSRNGTFLVEAIRDDKDKLTGEYKQPVRLPPGVFVTIKDQDIIYAGTIILSFENKKDD